MTDSSRVETDRKFLSLIIRSHLFSNMANQGAGKLVSVAEVSAFIIRCMTSVGTPEEHAASLADILVTADYRGHFSHGLNRLGTTKIIVIMCVP